jgi:hypothetical protein
MTSGSLPRSRAIKGTPAPARDGAGVLYDRAITPLSDAFSAKLALAQSGLNADTSGADNRAAEGAVGVAAIAGILLVLLFFVSAPPHAAGCNEPRSRRACSPRWQRPTR